MFMLKFVFFLFFLSCQTTEVSLKKEVSLPSYWPTKGWRTSTPEKQGIDTKKLIEMMKVIKNNDYGIDSLTIVRNGFLVTDFYKYPFRKGNKHIIHSVSKSFLSSLVGIAIDKGFIKSINVPVLDFFPNKKFSNVDKNKKSMTLEHLLMMASGLKTKDSWRYEWKGLTKMKSQDDWVQYLLDLPMEREPGKKFEYSNGVSYLISAILYKTTQMKPQVFAQRYLFEPLGISESDVRWEVDPSGIHIGWGGMRMRPQDMAKFGLLYLNKGIWEGKQILSKKWVESSTRKYLSSDIFSGYGYQWWSGSGSFNMDSLWRLRWKFWPKKKPPVRYYMAVGFLGQFIYVIPDRNMVVVFTSNLKDSKFFIPNALLDEYIIPAVISNSSLKEEKSKEFDSLVSDLEKERHFIWDSEKEGMVKGGLFIRKKSPSFKLKFPEGSYKTNLIGSNEIMAMTTSEGARFSISINDRPEDISLNNVDTAIKKGFESFGSNIKLISNESLTLNGGTPAFKTVIDWRFKSSFYLRTTIISVYQKRKWVMLSYSYDSLNKSLFPFFEKDGKLLITGWRF